MPRYWVVSVRGGDFNKLRELGFRVFYPVLDDYAFLEATEENKKFLRKQEALRIKFLRDAGGKNYQTVSEAEVNAMETSTRSKIEPGTRITVVEGHCEHLGGVVERVNEDGTLHCVLEGYARKYEADLMETQVVREDDFTN